VPRLDRAICGIAMKRLFRSTKCNFRDGGFVMKVLAYQVRPDEKQYVKTLAPIYGHDVIMVSEDLVRTQPT